MGRWQGGQFTVNDNGTVSDTALGNTSAHWLIGLAPGDSPFSTAIGPINNVQRLVGTSTYSLVASTKPTDSLGNVGTLNSASLTANFTAQTVDAGVNVSFPTRNLTLDANAHNVPIDGMGFKAAAQSPYAPTVNCTGSGCSLSAPSGYSGDIRGVFTASASAGATTGAVGTGAGMMYALTPGIVGTNFSTPPTPGSISVTITNDPFADLIQGAAAFSTTAAPTVGVNSSFADNANLRHRVVYPISMTGSTETAFASVSNSNFMPNTNYLFDASGNLARVHDSDYSLFTTGDVLTGTSTPSSSQFPTKVSPFTNAAISFGPGSTAAESYTSEGTAFSAIGLRMGRWQGGFVNVTDLNDFNTAYLDPLGNRSVHWVVAQVPSAIPTTGQFHYTRLPGATAGSLGFA
ncbi:MAG: hypothetical protein Q7R41_11465, partial [Phycisphaerales bacterium]|nr:hypothetical protein [Phycisphaerales bacterium]